MINPCEECPIEDKLYECCSQFPDTGEIKYLQINPSMSVPACPFLNSNGTCSMYEHRPLACSSHFCCHYISGRRILQDYLDIVSYW